MEKSYLTYEDFGALGNGINDDFDAIIAAHEEANRLGLPIKARSGAVYYIGGADKNAVIKTDVDFGTARFVIDDRQVERNASYVFSVESDYAFEPIEITTLGRTQKRIDIGRRGSHIVRVYNDDAPIYIRKGLNRNNGTATQDVFLVDDEGNIFPSVNFDYPKVTRAEAKRIDDTPITIKGGVFITIANHQESFYRYMQRGFRITRANVTICDYCHYVEGELEQGAPYHGFLRSEFAAHLTVKDAVITPRFKYFTESKEPGKKVAMGSYDLSFWSSVDVRCINVKQTIDITDDRYWGVYTSNFCKELHLDNCIFSRFDAHQGVTNFSVKNSRLGHMGALLIGFGEGLIENTEITSRALFSLRGDYGATWNGNITVKNCVWNPRGGCAVMSAWNEEDHDFGYPCSEPHTVTVEGLRINDASLGDKKVYLLPSFKKSTDGEITAPYGRVERLVLGGITTESGRAVELCELPELYPDVEVVGEL